MKVLGINGLGVLPSACLVVDGKIVSFAEEERFTRFKGSFGLMPGKAVKHCLQENQLKLSDVDSIVFAWDCNKYSFYMPLFLVYKYITKAPKFQKSSNLFSFIGEMVKYHPQNVKKGLKEMLRAEGFLGKMPKIEFVSHHKSHAASSFYTSGFEEAFTLVIDGSGEDTTTSIYYGKGTELSSIKTFKVPNSIGWFYQSFTEYLGFKPNQHEGKFMGLAAFGKPNPIIEEKLNKVLRLESNGKYSFAAKYSFLGEHERGRVFSEDLCKLFGEPKNKNQEFSQYHKDIAFGVQKLLEKVVLHIVGHLSQEKNYNGKLCIAGGVGLNCKMNGTINQHPKVNALFVPPYSSDAGTAIGAALLASKQGGYSPLQNSCSPYLGSSYTNAEIEAILKQINASYIQTDNVAKETAKLLSENKVVAWFQGKMEAGPRALGSRSILASPVTAEMQTHINVNIKDRETWRPFAASMLYDKKDLYVVQSKEAPYMAISYEVKPEMAKKIPAAIHVDNTTRPQFVKKNENEKYWNLINNFGELTGTYAILNTSFNTNEEPLVESPRQALKAFYGSAIDYLSIGDFIVRKLPAQ